MHYNTKKQIKEKIDEIYGKDVRRKYGAIISKERCDSIYKVFDVIWDELERGKDSICMTHIFTEVNPENYGPDQVLNAIFWFCSGVMPLLEIKVGTEEVGDLEKYFTKSEALQCFPKVLRSGKVEMPYDITLTKKNTLVWLEPTDMTLNILEK